MTELVIKLLFGWFAVLTLFAMGCVLFLLERPRRPGKRDE